MHHGAADRQSRVTVTHQAVIGRKAEVDAGPHLQGVGAIGVEGGAIAAQAVGHPQLAAVEAFEAGFLHRLEGGAGAIVRHHGG